MDKKMLYIDKVLKKQKNGNIINISSTYGLVAPDQRIYGKSGQNAAAFYSATKAAVVNLSRYLASYWNRTGIRVNTLSPGGVERKQDANFIKLYSEKTMLGRMAKNNEYVGAIIFLSSDASSYMTGSNLIVDVILVVTYYFVSFLTLANAPHFGSFIFKIQNHASILYQIGQYK